MKDVAKRVWDKLLILPICYEGKEELVNRACKAVAKGDVNCLYGEMWLFKPDNFSVERYPEEAVKGIVKKHGILRIVEEEIMKKA